MEQPKTKCETAESVLTEKDLKTIVHNAALDGWVIKAHDVGLAGKGLSGFLGDHFRLVLHLQKGDFTKKLHLFAKFMPLFNKPKADFIDEGNFFRRENLMYGLFDEMAVAGEQLPFCPKALIHTDNLLVMPDLSLEGYKSQPIHECLDLQHVLVVIDSMARFHARFACYEAKRDAKKNLQHSFYQENKEVFRDAAFIDSPWLRSAAKLVFDLLQAFSTKNLANIEETKLADLFVEACNQLTVSKDSLNVILHRDLWMNNIFFRYERDQPVHAILLDYQCVRYGPPAFDIMMFLYLTTTKEFRVTHERDVFNHYYTIFTQNLDDTVKEKLKDYNYGRYDFLKWCERARMFGITAALGISPYVLMAPTDAQKTFDNPDTYQKLLYEDRSEPILAYARQCPYYKERLLEMSDEFVERYMIGS